MIKHHILDTHLDDESIILEALCIQFTFQIGVRIGEGVAVKFSDTLYRKIVIQRIEERAFVFHGENFNSARVQIVEHLKKENDSEYRFIPLTDTENGIISKARTRKSSVHISTKKSLENQGIS